MILFGSYARGTATEDSDLDLMVIEKELPDKAAEYAPYGVLPLLSGSESAS